MSSSLIAPVDGPLRAESNLGEIAANGPSAQGAARINIGLPDGSIAPLLPGTNLSSDGVHLNATGGGAPVPAAADFVGSSGIAFTINFFSAGFTFADNALSVAFGTQAGTATEGNDPRVVTALSTEGGTMTGALELAADPAAALQAATKQYTDAGDAANAAAIETLGTTTVPLLGNVTVAGPLSYTGTPNAPYQLVNKLYVDTLASAFTAYGTPLGAWNAATNTPTYSNGGGGAVAKGFFQVTVAGSTTLDGNGPWGVGDTGYTTGAEWIRFPASGIYAPLLNPNFTSGTITAGPINLGGDYVQPISPYAAALGYVWASRTTPDAYGNSTIIGGIKQDGSLNWGVVNVTTHNAATANVGTLAITGSLSAPEGTIGGVLTQAPIVGFPLDYWRRDANGTLFVGYSAASDTWFFPNVTVLKSLQLSGTPEFVPEFCVDVTQYNAVGDGKRGHCYATWSNGGSTLTAYTYQGAVSFATVNGQTQLTIAPALNSGIGFQLYDENQLIDLPGCGVSGGDFTPTILKVINTTTCVISAAPSTTPSGSINVLWPAWASTDIGKWCWLSAAQFRAWWNSTVQQYFDTTDAYPTQPWMAKVAGATSNTLTLGTTIPGIGTGLPIIIEVGTDNVPFIAAAGQAMVLSGRHGLYFPGNGLYCGYSEFTGTAAEQTYLQPYDSTVGETNQCYNAEHDAIWYTGSARGHFTDTSGRDTHRVLIPIDAPALQGALKGVYGPKTLKATHAQTSPVCIIDGDSQGNIDPQVQNQMGTYHGAIYRYLHAGNWDKNWTILNFSMGGAKWSELASDANQRGGNVGNIYWFFTNTAVSWISYTLNASPVPDLIRLPMHEVNDGFGFHPQFVNSVIVRFLELVTRSGNPPDLILETSPGQDVAFAPAIITQNDWYSANSMYIRTKALKSGWGLIDWEDRALPSMWGSGPTRRLMCRMPDTTQTVSSTQPFTLNVRAQDWKGRFTLQGSSGSAVWGAFGALKFRLSVRSDNFHELSTDGSGHLTNYTQTWGRSVTSAFQINNNSTQLTTSGQTALTGTWVWTEGRTDLQYGSTPGGPFTSANAGMCLLVPSGGEGGKPGRTFIEKDLSDSVLRVTDFGPYSAASLNASGTGYIGGMLFTEDDGYGKPDCIVTDASGNVLVTKIASYISQTQVTLRDPWPYTGFNGTGAIFVGEITLPTTSTTIPAGTDTGANPFIDFGVRNDHMIIRYAVGSSVNLTNNWPNEPPTAEEGIVVRCGGRFIPVIECLGSGGQIVGHNLWIDTPHVTKPVGPTRYLRGIGDALAGYWLGGAGGHSSSPYLQHVAIPVLEAQDFTA